MEEIIDRIDKIIFEVTQFKKEPAFSIELKKRVEKRPPESMTESELLKIFVTLISFSQQAKSERVKKIIEVDTFSEILQDYSIDKVSKMNPCDLADRYWSKITAIRQQTKLFQIVMFSRVLYRHKHVLELLTNPPIPTLIKSQEDIKDFWKGFKTLQAALKEAKTPFLREKTTLLHFLLEVGYDCIKPDSAVMKAATILKIVENIKEKDKKVGTIKFIQNYALQRKLRPAAIDLYLLIAGRQTEASLLVDSSFYNTN